ncbi:MAG TPA: hypothetical protein GX705_01805 [Clostridiales bacterium]|nr:hypothetical protein [Clostridiales bacterium]
MLNLPYASKSGESIGFLNALFTATSANCVTGLVVVNTMGHWTLFGKIIILILIQFGALGFMTVITIAMMLTGQRISLRNRRAIQESFNQDNIGTNSFIPFQSSIPINFIIMILIIAGGLGFNVWLDTIRLFRNKEKKSLRLRMIHMSLHSKIVLTVTGILIVGGMLLFLLLEWDNPDTIGKLTVLRRIQASLFQSVTLRTAGFNTVGQGELTEISKFISCVWMLIGGSPAGTAGGMKTVTIGVIAISVVSILRGRNRLEVFGRTLPFDLLQKALSVVATMLTVVFVSTILLYFTELSGQYHHSFIDLLYEVCSAVGTVGLTTGITSSISNEGKVILIICMYLGRLSPVTIAIALNAKLHRDTNNISLPKERVIIG